MEEKIARCIISLKDVHPPIVIIVKGDHTQSLSVGVGDLCFFTDVSERTVSIVMKKLAGRTFELFDQAIGLALKKSARKFQFVIRKVVTDIKIEVTIVVIVEKCRTRSPARVVDSCLQGHICKRSIAIVSVKLARAITCNVHVRPAIVVVVSHSQPHAEHAVGDAGALRHVRESAIAVVAVENVPEFAGAIRLRRL